MPYPFDEKTTKKSSNDVHESSIMVESSSRCQKTDPHRYIPALVAQTVVCMAVFVTIITVLTPDPKVFGPSADLDDPAT